MTPPIAFVDTETTCLGHLACPWEIGIVRREFPPPNEIDGQPAVTGEWLFQVEYGSRDLPPGTDPESLHVGKWWERSFGVPGIDWREQFAAENPEVYLGRGPEFTIARKVHQRLLGAVLVGVGPHFDTAVLSRMFLRHGLDDQPWHYAILDVKAIAYGASLAAGRIPELPLQSDQLAEYTGAPITPKADRHTALGDARWAAAWWDELHALAAVQGA